MLDEQSLRTSTFRDGPRVKLADGQDWVFPRPKFRIFPVEDAEGKIASGFRPTFGTEHDQMMAVFLGVANCTTGELFDMRFKAACGLLRRNYNLTTDHLGELLVFVEDDPASEAMWEAIDSILVGSEPKKPSPAGSATPS